MMFQDGIHLFPNDNFIDPLVRVSDLNSRQKATENFNEFDLVGESPKLELHFIILVQHIFELIVFGE